MLGGLVTPYLSWRVGFLLEVVVIAVVGPMVRFVGRGYGHGVGLDQWSAKTMADQGYNAQRIVLYYYPGATIGGPVLIPGTRFNKNRDKLFFFVSYEYYYQKVDEGASRRRRRRGGR